MNVPIAIFYHCLLRLGTPPKVLPGAADIVSFQMACIGQTGLRDAAQDFIVGLNDNEGGMYEAQVLIPPKAKYILHGLSSRSECLTIVALENWVRTFDTECYILYMHTKGASHPLDSGYRNGVSIPWMHGMTQDLVFNWRQCIADLDAGAELCCSHFMRNMADGTQHIPAGGFCWVKASFARTLPSIFLRERIKMSGIESLESRYEAEVYWGNGPRLPNVKEYRPGGGGGVP
jgi:hypothetical protein